MLLASGADRADRAREHGVGLAAAARPRHPRGADAARRTRSSTPTRWCGRFDLARDVKDVDLVGISVDSKTARRSYDIADAYRRRGVPVVLGGIHPTACPEEARGARRRGGGRARRRTSGRALARGREARGALAAASTARRCPTSPASRSRGATSSARAATSPSRSCRRCAAARTRASSAACRRRTAPPCASGRRTTCWPSSATLGKLDHVRRRQRDDPPRLLARPLHAHDPARASTGSASARSPPCGGSRTCSSWRTSGCKALFVGFESIDEETMRFTGKRQNRPSEYKETIAHAARARHLGLGQLRLRLRHRRPRGVRPHRRVRHRDAAHDGDLRHADARTPGPRSTAGSRAEGRLTDARWWLRDVPRGGGAVLRADSA